ncbi:MAG: UDP-N-acetylmuramoyl-tripeptide--D-alanyl-D-alanine ligase [Chloroflexota bacterium]
MLTLGTIVEGITGRRLSGLGQVITDAAIDSRLAISGGLFVALPGERTDGHEHVAEAFARGAIAALVERDMGPEFDLLDLRDLGELRPRRARSSRRAVEPSSASITTPVCLRVDNTLLALQAAAKHWRQQLSHREFHRQALRVIAITGSVGKSTTKELAAEILQRRFRTHRNPGNLNNEIGLPLSVLQISSAQERAVLEMGFYVPGEIALLCEIARPQVGVITNVSEVHLERAGSLEAIVQGKGELVESLPPAPEGVAILNIDDGNVRGMASRTRARVFYYGLSPDADLWASDVEGLGLEGVRFQLHHLGEIFHVRVPLLGQHSVHTALRAAAVGLAEGMSWDDIIAGLQQTHSQLRLVAVNGPGGSLLLDDTYNAAPPSVIAALNLLQELEGRHIAVLGDMLELGEFEERGHRMVGARAAEVVHELVTVGERARWIAEEALRAGMPQAALATLPDSQAAVEYLRSRIGAGDVVLIKGSRGVHMDEIVNELEVSD